MKIKDYKCKCGHSEFFFAVKGKQKGICCLYCGRWLKWANKDEQNLDIKSNNFFDLEDWLLDLLKGIQVASEKGENYDLHLESKVVNEIAEIYKATKWIGIY